MPLEEDFRLCLVCQATLTTMHLGMDVCRACSSFFKRAKTIGAQYPCRQGTRKCTVSKDGKFMCRRCRLDRCLLVGMAYEGPTRTKPLLLAVSQLQRVGKEYMALIERRQKKEIELLRTCGIRLPHPKQEMYYVHVPASVEVYTIAVVEAIPFFENAFPSLEQLERHERDTIFKDYVAKVNLISSYYCGRKYWGDCKTKTMCSTATCYDSEVSFDFYYPGATENKGAFQSSLRSHANDHVAIFFPIFNRARITETEFHALAALIMTDHDLAISERAHQLLDGIRAEIFEDLQSYYQNEIALRDFSTRLGNLITLNHAVQECCAIFRVYFGFYSSIFDNYMVNRSMEELLLGST